MEELNSCWNRLRERFPSLLECPKKVDLAPGTSNSASSETQNFEIKAPTEIEIKAPILFV